jgi:hypothetical protein
MPVHHSPLVTQHASLSFRRISRFLIDFSIACRPIIKKGVFCIQNIKFHNDSVSAKLESAGLTVPFVLYSLSGATLSSKIIKLHDPVRDFRDSCGFALLAHMDGEKSHWLVQTTLESLARLTHRGAVAADGKSGDGCGIMLQFPEPFLRDVAEECGFKLSEHFASGLVFFSHDEKLI